MSELKMPVSENDDSGDDWDDGWNFCCYRWLAYHNQEMAKKDAEIATLRIELRNAQVKSGDVILMKGGE